MLKLDVLVVILQRQCRLMMYLVVVCDLHYVLLKCLLEMVELSVVDYLIVVYLVVDVMKFAHFRPHLVNPDVDLQKLALAELTQVEY